MMFARLPEITVLESGSWEGPSKVWFPTPGNMSCCHLSRCSWIPGVLTRAAHITCCKQERSGELCLKTWILEPNCLDPTPDLGGAGRVSESDPGTGIQEQVLSGERVNGAGKGRNG